MNKIRPNNFLSVQSAEQLLYPFDVGHDAMHISIKTGSFVIRLWVFYILAMFVKCLFDLCNI